MTNHRILALSLLLFSAGAFAMPGTASPAIRAAQESDVERLLRERLSSVDQLAEEELWEEAATLAQLAEELDPEQLDRALDHLLAGSELGSRATLLLVVARLDGDEPDLDALAARLGTLLAASDPAVARGAAALLSDERFRQIEPDRLEELLEALLDGSADAQRDPETRIELAVAAWKQGGGREKRQARSEMRAFLDSSDARLRNLAALALARIGDIETARGELERMSVLPGPEGRLASAYLRVDFQREYFESKLRKQRERLQEALDEKAPAKDLAQVERLITTIQNRHVEGGLFEREDLIDAALDGMLRSLDQHSSYLPSAGFKRFQQDLEGEYGGIGAYVQEDPEDHLFTITRPIYSGPAYKANLRSDDKIVQIDDWPTHENGRSKPTDDIIRKLKGKPGTAVKLYVWRQGMDPALISRPSEEMVVEVMRDLITIPPMRADILPGGIGLCELSTFSGVASQELGLVLQKMVEAGVKGIVLDLRNNSGGLLDEAQAVSDLFLPPNKLVVTTEERLRPPMPLKTHDDPILPEDMPVVVLINRFSASASEIVAGALRDHGRAVLVGQRSYGKGTVQHLLPMGQDDYFDDDNRNRRRDNWEVITKDWNENGEFDFASRAKLTIARWRIPSGKSIHREFDEEGNLVSLGGIEPDHGIDPRRWEGWRLELMFELQRDRRVREWIAEQWPIHKDLFEELAYGDGKDPARYPGFGEFYESLGTMLSREDVRYLVRSEVRRRVQDDRGAAFPQGDYQEDVQLQKAIELVLEELGRSPYELEPYKLTFASLQGGEPPARTGAVAEEEATGEERLEVRDALAMLARAGRGEVQLTQENLEHLRNLLSKLDQ